MSALPRLPLQKRADVYDDAVQTITNAVNTKRDELNRTSGGEWAIRGIGAGVGGLLGYYLSGKLHEKPAKVTRLLYALGGAGLGGVTADALITDAQRGRMRFNSVFDKDDKVQQAAQDIENNYLGIAPGLADKKGVRAWAPWVGGTTAGIGLAIVGAKSASKFWPCSGAKGFGRGLLGAVIGGGAGSGVGALAGYAIPRWISDYREARPDLGQVVAGLMAKR